MGDDARRGVGLVGTFPGRAASAAVAGWADQGWPGQPSLLAEMLLCVGVTFQVISHLQVDGISKLLQTLLLWSCHA